MVQRCRSTASPEMHVLAAIAALLVWATSSAGAADSETAAESGNAAPCGALYPIITEGGLGFIDATGAVIVKPQFDETDIRYAFLDADVYREFLPYDRKSGCATHFWGFYEGIGIVAYEGKFGYIGADGRILFQPQFDRVSRFRDGLAWAKVGNEFLLLNSEGKVVTSGLEGIGRFTDGLAPAQKNGKWGFVNRAGQFVIEPRFDSVDVTVRTSHLSRDPCFAGGVAIVEVAGHQGVINRHGEFIFPPQYEWIFPFKAEWAVFRKGDKAGLLNRQGKEVIPATYDSVSCSVREGVVAVKVGEKWGAVNLQNQCVVPIEFDDVRAFHEGLAAIKMNGKYGFVDHAGKVVIPAQFASVRDFCDGVAIVTKPDNNWGVINSSGDFLGRPEYDAIENFSEGLAIVRQGNAMGAIDRSGAVIIEIKYHWLSSFKNGYAEAATTDRERRVINAAGELMFSPEVAWVDQREGAGLRVYRDQNWMFGYVDALGHIVIPATYDRAEPFDGGIARVGIEVGHYVVADEDSILYNGKWGYINPRGNWIWKPTR